MMDGLAGSETPVLTQETPTTMLSLPEGTFLAAMLRPGQIKEPSKFSPTGFNDQEKGIIDTKLVRYIL
jgi:hypothetical protein